VKVLAIQAGLTVLAMGFTLGVCLLTVRGLQNWGFLEVDYLPSVLVAGAVSAGVGLLMALYFSLLGIGAAALVFGSLLRVALTLGVGLVVANSYGYWNRPFFATLAVFYATNLAVETWWVYQKNRQQSRVRVSSV